MQNHFHTWNQGYLGCYYETSIKYFFPCVGSKPLQARAITTKVKHGYISALQMLHYKVLSLSCCS
jgi:hypothetical protein